MIVNYLVVGLGNYDSKYKNNRHNVGFIVLESICTFLKTPDFKQEKTSFCSLTTLKIKEEKFFFVKPETYMNNSGKSVQQLKNFYKIENQNIIVLYDEIDLPRGKCKISSEGGDNGHNGVKSIDSLCGKSYHKFKIGVGRSENPNIPVADFVLSDLSNEEIIHAGEIGKTIGSLIEKLFDKNGQSIILNKISKLKLTINTNSS